MNEPTGLDGRHPRPTPQVVTDLAAGRDVHPVWENELGGLTFEVGAGDQRCFIKWSPAGNGIDLYAETMRMRWASGFTPVPTVLEEGADTYGSWIITTPLKGESAVSHRWRARPGPAVAAIGRGLRALHDALPVQGCPFSWSATERAASARRRADQLDPQCRHPVHHGVAVDEALGIADDPPSIDRLVVCHGDACAPNSVVTDDGQWAGHVDLGDLGVADCWADLAVATWSTDWNYGPGWEDDLLAAYGITPDPPRMAYYRLLWDLGP